LRKKKVWAKEVEFFLFFSFFLWLSLSAWEPRDEAAAEVEEERGGRRRLPSAALHAAALAAALSAALSEEKAPIELR
jgi:hypothetical protein